MEKGLALARPPWMIALGIIIEAARLRRACRCSACMCEGGKRKNFHAFVILRWRIGVSAIMVHFYNRVRVGHWSPAASNVLYSPVAAFVKAGQRLVVNNVMTEKTWDFFFFFYLITFLTGFLVFDYVVLSIFCWQHIYISLLVDDLLSQVFQTCAGEKIKMHSRITAKRNTRCFKGKESPCYPETRIWSFNSHL